MFGLSPLEIAVILILLVVLFGKRLPEIGSSLGKAINNFKNSSSDQSVDKKKFEHEENTKIDYDQVVDEYKPCQVNQKETNNIDEEKQK